MTEEFPNSFKIGQGIFGLSDQEKKLFNFNSNELTLIKPYYTTEQLKGYYGDKKNVLWIIYTNSEFKNPQKIKSYPNVKKHLDSFKDLITSDNKPYGLHRARDERFFKDEKIIAQRKCATKPLFTYTDFECYVSATFNIIKSARIDLKYLTILLNSKLIAFWLKHKGKMQGTNYQIDKEPLLNIPILIPYETSEFHVLFDEIVKRKKIGQEISQLEKKADDLIFSLYELSKEEILLINGNK